MTGNKGPASQNNDASLTPPVYIRVPLNTHPSHLTTPTGYGAIHDDSSYQVSGTSNSNSLAGSPTSFFRGFTGSYSRTSALYMAENLSIRNELSAVVADAPTTDTGTTGIPSLVLDEESIIKTQLLPINHTLTETLSQHGSGLRYSGLSRHTTVASMISQQYLPETSRKSTFVQSVFNSINVLVGIGVLALPLAFRCAGWLMGSLVFLFCVLSTNYTAKVITKCLDFYPNSTTYGDIGAAAFGDRGRTFVSVVFVVELMTIGYVCIYLYTFYLLSSHICAHIKM